MKNTLLALTLTATSAFAQQPAAPIASAAVDARLAPWLGCWRLDDDLAGTGARMCITPEKNGVRMQTIAGAQRGIDELVIPDAIAHAITDTDCKGTERAEFSKDGARVFRTTEVTCGKEPPRTIKSVAFMAAGPSWVNVQMISGTAANTAVRVQRYRRAVNQQLADGTKAPQPSANVAVRTSPEMTTWSVEDVIEVSAKVPTDVVQAAIAEVHQGFSMNKRTLVALADGGVDSQVIDLMVALTYPQRFVVERRGGGGTPSGVLTGGGWFDPMMTAGMMGSMLDCYSPVGYGYRSYYSMCGNSYGYSPLGYDYYGYNRYYGYGYPGSNWVDIGSIPPSNGGTAVDSGEGRVVNGRGYTQIRNRETESAPRVSGGSNGGAAGWSGANAGSASSSGYSSGSASSSGSSGGGSSSSGDSGARTAVPKGGGGQ